MAYNRYQSSRSNEYNLCCYIYLNQLIQSEAARQYMALAARMISILDKIIRQNRGYFEETDFAIGYHDLYF